MSQAVRRKNLGVSSLRTRQSAHSVLAQMAADEARADRIRQLKLDHPELTWKAIADHVGVQERSALDWQKTGGIGYENAKKLAELFPEVTLDYLWRGEAPDLMSTLNGSAPDDLQAQLTRIEDKLDAVLTYLDAAATERHEESSEAAATQAAKRSRRAAS
jgi:hypothetical protein